MMAIVVLVSHIIGTQNKLRTWNFPFLVSIEKKLFCVQIRSLEQLARLKEEERRSVLHHMDDTQYQNVVRVLGAMPYVEMDIKYEVVDDEATTVYTAGAIVTVRFSPSFIRIN